MATPNSMLMFANVAGVMFIPRETKTAEEKHVTFVSPAFSGHFLTVVL